MILLGIDLETTTFDQEVLRITELGAVLYDTEYNMPIEIQADLVKEPDMMFPMDAYVQGLTGITDAMLIKYGKHPHDVVNNFHSLYERADLIIAHNGNNFDKPALSRFIARYNKELKLDFTAKHWLDTMTDIPYSEYINTRKLEDLTGRHGFLNPFPHRAFTDVMAMLKVLSNYDLQTVIDISKSPELLFFAAVDYHSRDVAKAAGFRWNSDGRVWEYKIKKYFVDLDKRNAGTLWDFPYKESEKTRNL